MSSPSLPQGPFYITPHPSGQFRWWLEHPPTKLPSRLSTTAETTIILQLLAHNANHSEDVTQLTELGIQLQELFRAYQPSAKAQPHAPT